MVGNEKYFAVGRHLLEGQGALVEEDGRTLWVSLMSTQPDPTGPGAGTAVRAERTPEAPAAEEPAAEELAAEEPETEQSEADVQAPEESARVPVSD